MHTLFTTAAAAVTTFVVVAVASVHGSGTQKEDAVARQTREVASSATHEVADDVRRDLNLVVEIVDDGFPRATLTTQSSTDAVSTFALDISVVSAEGEVVIPRVASAQRFRTLDRRAQAEQDLPLAELEPGMYMIRAVLRGGTLRNLQEQQNISYIRVTDRGVSNIEYREWNESAPAAQGQFVNDRDEVVR